MIQPFAAVLCIRLTPNAATKATLPKIIQRGAHPHDATNLVQPGSQDGPRKSKAIDSHISAPIVGLGKVEDISLPEGELTISAVIHKICSQMITGKLLQTEDRK